MSEIRVQFTGSETLHVAVNGVGVAGKSAYDVAVANGFGGTEAEWLSSLVAPLGTPVACPAYTVATVPDAADGAGLMIYVTDPAVGDARPYWSDGALWRDAAGTVLA